MNKKALVLPLISLVFLTVSCGQAQSGAKLQSVPSGVELPLSSIGRGATMTLTKDLEVPANSDSIIMDVVQSTFRTDHDETNVYHKTYTVCGIQMKSASVDRRVIPAGTVFNFTGEAGSHPMDANSNFKSIDLSLSSPTDALSVGCLNLVTQCWQGLCDPYEQASFSIRDFKNYMSGTATVDQATPVIVQKK